jgi:hypothetical protein
MKITIFYSWQSTTDTKYNKNFISDCIKEAIKKIKQIPDFSSVEFDNQDGVREEAGSPAVADKIDERIVASDIFIADLSVVNFSNKFQQFIRKLIGDKYKPFQNNNVIKEYGVAKQSIGVERIIGVLNNKYGSPKKNPDNIPFDIRHLRFPIEYFLSKKNDKSEVKKQVVNDLINALKPTIQSVLETQKSRFRPFIAWNEWNELMKNPQAEKFIENDKIKEIKTAIQNINNSSPVRILGLSGLGKTRIVFEIFRPQTNNNNSLIFSNRVLYVNCNDYQQNINFIEIINKISTDKNDAILIVDNCNFEIHGLITRNLKNLSFISIDSNPEESHNTNGTSYITIGKNDLSDVVTQLVDRDFQNTGKENIEKIKEFSDGIPLMAVLLAESIQNGERFIGKLNDKDLLDKLLGKKGKEAEWRSILKSCSLFSYFGYEMGVEYQYKFIATNPNITISNNSEQVRLSTFVDVINHYKSREIFEEQGRYLKIRPFPLAMNLAVEWLDTCDSDRLLQVIIDIAKLDEPHRTQLTNAFADQMKLLGYNDKAIEIVEKIVGQDSPFDNAEVLNTELGSRLFRSFVEVNPVAVSQNFSRQFSNKATDELLEIKQGRRNIVWALEKLCFDNRTFIESAKILYQFAVAENETWGNNATGQFLQLFHIVLAGTEADLKARWSIIEWGLNQNDEKFYQLALKAMKSGLKTGHFHRTGGAEKQGTKHLADYTPVTYNEMYEYWGNILTKLTEIISQKNEYYDFASNIVADSLRGFYFNGHSHFVIPYISKIILSKNNDWDRGLENLKMTLHYDKNKMSDEVVGKTKQLIQSLTKTDFISRFYASTQYEDDDIKWSSEKFIEREKSRMEDLAKEFIDTNVSWEDTFPIFYKRDDKYLMSKTDFGKNIYELIKDDTEKVNLFINKSLHFLSSINKEQIELSILLGFIEKADDKVRENLYLLLFNSEQLNYLLFQFISFDADGGKYFDKLFELIDNQKCDVSNFNCLKYRIVLQKLSPQELQELKEKLYSYGNDGYALVFDLFTSIRDEDVDFQNVILPIVKECVYKLGTIYFHGNTIDEYQWAKHIIQILQDEKESDFAKFIIQSLIDSVDLTKHISFDHNIQQICEALVQYHFDSIWDILSKALLGNNEDFIKYWELKHIFGSHIGGVGRDSGILFDGNIEMIFEWCNENKPEAPRRLAGLVPIYNNDNRDYTKWNPIAKRLIDEFGNNQEMLNELDCNMGSFSWVGSVIPLLKAKKELFESLVNHPISNVREWANRNLQYITKEIENETNREAEYFL